MITEGYLVRHYQGRSGGRGPALIDIAQDHLLFHLSERGLFDLGVALKGGTAIRKLRAGTSGRFSTDLGRRPLWLTPEMLRPITLPIHQRYDFELPAVPTARIEEVVAEKLARYRRTSLARDLYDLAWLASRPFDPEEILRVRSEKEFQPEAIGYLTTAVDMPGWVRTVCDRYAFVRDFDGLELRISRCSRGEVWVVERAIAALR